MADAVISALLDQLASITRERVEKKVSLVMGVDDEVENLGQNLQAIRMVLMDAEKRQLKDEGVKLWLDELKDVSYDMDSTLDEWITTILKSEIQQGANGSVESGTSSSADKITKRKVWFSILFSCFHSSKLISLQAISHSLEVANEIKGLNEKLEKITIRKDRFKFRRTSSDIVERLKGPDTTSFLDVPVVYGQDNNKKFLIDRLMLSGSSSQEGKELKIISIVGIGGIGKTTLAKNVYNDDEVKACFGGGQRIWVCVSEPFDIIKIAKEIIEQLNGEAPSVLGLEALMQKFHESIEGKKFLLVLDDVWTTRYNEWAPLEQVLRFGAAGSRVVVTTRNEKVAKMMGDMDMIRLNKLSEEDCWLLLSLRNSDNCEMLPPFGKLPCLESLDIVQSNSLKKMGPEFLGLEIDDNIINSSLTSGTLFPKLKRLNIQYMMSLCEWVWVPGWEMNGPLKIMPRLESLYLIQCQSLISLPDFLELTPLKLLNISFCPALKESCRKETGKDWPKIRHVPNIQCI